MSTDTLTQDILDARRNLPRFIPDDLLIITNTNAARDLADHLTTRGWRQQTTITTIEELNALPARTVIREADGNISERISADDDQWWGCGWSDINKTTSIELPARVLYIPEEQ